jgi:hypothetical protein
VHDIEVRTVAAITSTAGDSILSDTATDGDTVHASMIDMPDQVFVSSVSKAGRPLTITVSRQVPGAAKGDFESRTIDFTKHEWSEQHLANGGVGNPAAAFLRVIRGAVAGGAKVVGTETVAGRVAYKLDLGPTANPSGHHYLLIDEATSLPVKSVGAGGTDTYTWSAAGSINPATLWPNVPAGFTEVDPARLPAGY